MKALQEMARLVDVGGRSGLEVHTPERQLEQLSNVRLVINDKYLFFIHKIPSSLHSSVRAKIIWKRLPTPPGPGW